MISKSFYKESNSTYHILFIVSSVAMIMLSAYLTSHYFDVKYPVGLANSSLCDINSFFNCDVSTHSPASNLMGVPISVFGVLMGIFLLFGYLFNGEKTEGTNHALLILNFIGCITLFFYSLIFLGGLCPFCTLYYIASGIALYCFRKNSNHLMPAALPLIIYIITAGATSAFFYNHSAKKDRNIDSLAKSTVSEFKKLVNLGNPGFDSEFRIISSTEKFSDAPIQISKFSDFQCPSCKMLSEVLHQLGKRYPGKINIQYYFYPLDMACNSAMEREMHRYACQASYISICKPQDFPRIEKYLFDNQQSFSAEFIKKLAKDEGVTECINSPATKEKAIKYISVGSQFNIKSTPTFFINGRKIEGALPLVQVRAIIDYLLNENN